jgi:hypothetical protein
MIGFPVITRVKIIPDCIIKISANNPNRIRLFSTRFFNSDAERSGVFIWLVSFRLKVNFTFKDRAF